MKDRSDVRQHDYDVAYMDMADRFSHLSYALRKKVGAIIVSSNDQIISQGYNGTPHGFCNVCEEVVNNVTGEVTNYDEEPLKLKIINTGIINGKYRDISLKTKKIVLHAEANAIMKVAKNVGANSTEGSTLYVTLSPCIDCAKMIAQAGITKVIYKEEYRSTDGIDFLKQYGVEVVKL